jgi:hypothetical protein
MLAYLFHQLKRLESEVLRRSYKPGDLSAKTCRRTHRPWQHNFIAVTCTLLLTMLQTRLEHIN